ncbi:MAG: tyrosine-protein phosphatase [Phycisphaerales bacterium]|nr:tyrosine-protein phosphatase [Phycisphaerales bacterium]
MIHVVRPILIGLLLWTLWDTGLKPELLPKNFGVVEPGRLYRSGELTPGSTKLVAERFHIRTIIDLGAHEPGSKEEALAQETARTLGLERFRFNLEGDARGDPNHYLEALRLMTDPARQPVLVHCAAGSQRTGCAIALYRHIVEDVDLEEAYDEASEYRHDPKGNPHLKAMLDTWALKIRDAFEGGGRVE